MVELLDREETRKALKLSDATIRRLVKRGELPVVEIGGRKLFRSSDLEAFIERRLRQEGTSR